MGGFYFLSLLYCILFENESYNEGKICLKYMCNVTTTHLTRVSRSPAHYKTITNVRYIHTDVMSIPV